MKNYFLFKLALSLLVLFAVISCEEDEVGPFEPDSLTISGPNEVAPGATATYYTSLYEEATYNWTVPAGVTITEGAGTFSIDVAFDEAFSTAGSGEISVSAVGVEGSKTVTLTTTTPMATVTLDSTVAALAEGASANVTITFDQDIATDPDVSIIGPDSISRDVSNLERIDPRTYQFTYTAGEMDGFEQIGIDNAISSPFFGGEEMDTIMFFDSYVVDNTPATGELTASNTPVSDSTSATISAIFSEPLSTSDTVKVSINGLTEAYVTEASMMTEDGQVWTYEFQPEGGANEIVTVSVSNLPPDPAGNPTEPVDPIAIQIKND